MACPICKAETVKEFRPFCSKRCADIDLGRWLRGSYAIPTDEAPDPSNGPLDRDDSPERQH